MPGAPSATLNRVRGFTGRAGPRMPDWCLPHALVPVAPRWHHRSGSDTSGIRALNSCRGRDRTHISCRACLRSAADENVRAALRGPRCASTVHRLASCAPPCAIATPHPRPISSTATSKRAGAIYTYRQPYVPSSSSTRSRWRSAVVGRETGSSTTSDRGTRYTSIASRLRARKAGITLSIGPTHTPISPRQPLSSRRRRRAGG